MGTKKPRNVYDNTFFDDLHNRALESARVVAPMIRELIHPSSVVDIGCGRGAWLRAFQENGAKVIRGLDGDYVDRETLLIPRDAFTPADLSELTSIPGKYDLAICLEVLEHLTPKSGLRLVSALTEAAPVVLFSAAVPGQGGTEHINEQWPDYWAKLFEARAFRLIDPLRRHIRDDKRVAWYYRQNIFMFASEEAITSRDALQLEAARDAQPEIEWTYVSLVRERPRGIVRTAMGRAVPVRVKRRLKAALAFVHSR